MDLMPKDTADLDGELTHELNLFEDDEVDDGLVEIQMPKGYKRCFRNSYLKSRGFIADDYEFSLVGRTATSTSNTQITSCLKLEIKTDWLVLLAGIHGARKRLMNTTPTTATKYADTTIP